MKTEQLKIVKIIHEAGKGLLMGEIINACEDKLTMERKKFWADMVKFLIGAGCRGRRFQGMHIKNVFAFHNRENNDRKRPEILNQVRESNRTSTNTTRGRLLKPVSPGSLRE